MADTREIAQVIATMKAAWPNYQPTSETPSVFLAILGDLPGELIKVATLQCAGENRAFAPSAGEIRDAAVRIKAREAGYPSAMEAYREVCDMPPGMKKIVGQEWDEATKMNWLNYADLQFSNPLIEKVARLMGWPREFPTDAPGVDRAQFCKTYEAELQREFITIRELPQVRAYIEGNQRPELAENKIKQLAKGFEK